MSRVTASPDVERRPISTSLDAEWRRIARHPVSRRAVKRWAATQPALRGIAHLDELLERRRDPAAAPAILAALAALSPRDELAARTLLQAVLPGLVKLGSSSSVGYDDPRAVDHMVALAWERIRTYPPGRPGPVAGNVLLDVRKRYQDERGGPVIRRHRGLDRPRLTYLPADPGGVELMAGRDGQHLGWWAPSAEDEAVARLSFEEMVAAVRPTVSELDFRALVRTQLAGLSLKEVAAEEGTALHTVKQRRWRALQQLRQLPVAG